MSQSTRGDELTGTRIQQAMLARRSEHRSSGSIHCR